MSEEVHIQGLCVEKHNRVLKSSIFLSFETMKVGLLSKGLQNNIHSLKVLK